MLPQDMSHLRTERDNAWLRTADRAVAESPVKYCLSEQGYSFKGQTKAVGPRSCCVRRCAVAYACMRCLPGVTNGRVRLRAASRMNTRRMSRGIVEKDRAHFAARWVRAVTRERRKRQIHGLPQIYPCIFGSGPGSTLSRKIPVKTTLNKMLFCRHGNEDRGYDGLGCPSLMR